MVGLFHAVGRSSRAWRDRPARCSAASASTWNSSKQQIFVGFAFLVLAVIALGGGGVDMAAGVALCRRDRRGRPRRGVDLDRSGHRILRAILGRTGLSAFPRRAGVPRLRALCGHGRSRGRDCCWRRRRDVGRPFASAARSRAGVLLAIGAFEFWPLPARAHDVLPTSAHRWLVDQPATGPTLDCYPANQADRFVPWLMQRPLSFLGDPIKTCSDPELGRKLAALGYTHVIVRGGEASSKLVQPLPPGITVAEDFPDSHVYTVASTLPPVVTVAATGFYDYEHQNDDWWRWMSPRGTMDGPQYDDDAAARDAVGRSRSDWHTAHADRRARRRAAGIAVARHDPAAVHPWSVDACPGRSHARIRRGR